MYNHAISYLFRLIGGSGGYKPFVSFQNSDYPPIGLLKRSESDGNIERDINGREGFDLSKSMDESVNTVGDGNSYRQTDIKTAILNAAEHIVKEAAEKLLLDQTQSNSKTNKSVDSVSSIISRMNQHPQSDFMGDSILENYENYGVEGNNNDFDIYAIHGRLDRIQKEVDIVRRLLKNHEIGTTTTTITEDINKSDFTTASENRAGKSIGKNKSKKFGKNGGVTTGSGGSNSQPSSLMKHDPRRDRDWDVSPSLADDSAHDENDEIWKDTSPFAPHAFPTPFRDSMTPISQEDYFSLMTPERDTLMTPEKASLYSNHLLQNPPREQELETPNLKTTLLTPDTSASAASELSVALGKYLAVVKNFSEKATTATSTVRGNSISPHAHSESNSSSSKSAFIGDVGLSTKNDFYNNISPTIEYPPLKVSSKSNNSSNKSLNVTNDDKSSNNNSRRSS